jgi:protein-S-isoprenylcysteine O-methyltransferase Ste14
MEIKEVRKFKGYFFNLILIWSSIAIYHLTPYYKEFLRNDVKIVILYLAILYSFMGFFYYLFKSKDNITDNRGSLVFIGIFTISKNLYNLKNYFKNKKINWINLEKNQKNSILFILVKFFFIPIMFNFTFSNYYSVKNGIFNLPNFLSLFSINSFNTIIFPLVLSLIFLIDTAWFCFGYLFESNILKNRIISVEPSIFGWLVALACYPPFNGIVGSSVDWYANDYAYFFNSDFITFIFRILIVLLLLIYVSATLALGTKSSNLTNRGIVSRGPYKYIRHPAYISKNLAWWLTTIPVFSIWSVISMGTWSIIYHLRSITEERHLKKDPNYIDYVKKVKYRYVPKIY